MKLLPSITHPVLVLCSFCMILVSGEHFGGPYLLYLLMAIPHGGLHAVLALIGAGLMLYSYGKYQRRSQFLIDPVLNILGICCLVYSLYIFFVRSSHYNDGTFEQGVPIFTMALFGVLALGFLLYSVIRFAKVKPGTSHLAF